MTPQIVISLTTIIDDTRIGGGAEPRISGGSYKRSFVYAEVRIQYTNSYTDVVYCIRNVAEETRIQYRYSYTDSKLGSK